MDICTIYHKALTDKKWKGKVEEITLDYTRRRGRFMWIVEKQEVPMRNVRHIIIPYTYYDARTGRILTHKVRHAYVVCRLPQF